MVKAIRITETGNANVMKFVDVELKKLAPNEGMTMACVTHEMGFAKKVSNRVIFMDEGKIVEDCTKDNFFNNQTSLSVRAKEFLSKILR